MIQIVFHRLMSTVALVVFVVSAFAEAGWLVLVLKFAVGMGLGAYAVLAWLDPARWR